MTSIEKAREVYEALCGHLEQQGLKFARHDDDMVVTLGISGEDMPMDLIIAVSERNALVTLYSPLPFQVTEKKRVDAAVAVCVADNGLANGSFDYDITTGKITFRVAQSFLQDTVPAPEVFTYMLSVAVGTVGKYGDRFLMLSKELIDIQQFIEMDQED